MRSLLNHTVAVIAATGTLLFAAPASATRMFADFTGVVVFENQYGASYDTSNFFGLGDDLVGASFTSRFLYDTSLGISSTGLYYDILSGGPNMGGGISPILSASFTLNGVTDYFNVDRNGSANVTNNSQGWQQTFLYVDFFPPGGSTANALQLYVLNSPSLLNPRLNQPFTGGNLPNVMGPDTDPFAWNIDGTNNYYLALNAVTVTLSRAPIPEPTTWTLMIGGILLAGGMIRRQRALVRLQRAT